ncbi:MAG: ATPase, partial [Acidobacteria bacterium]|nr:ATPase [Acidobacteriota bacterium]
MPLTLLCIATYLKGHEFLRECHRQGHRVLLLTEEKLRDADWPRDAVDGFFYVRREMPQADVRSGAAHLART